MLNFSDTYFVNIQLYDRGWKTLSRDCFSLECITGPLPGEKEEL